MSELPTRPTWSVYRDEPVEHVRTVPAKDGRPYAQQYQCVCGCRLWTDNDDRLEEFLCEHDACAKETA